MADKPPYSPGCFGLPFTFAEDEVCTVCAYASECRVVHLRAKQQLREFCGVSVKEPTRVRGQLPAKVQKIFDELGRTVDEVKQAMQAGANPYSIKASFVGIACHVLLQSRKTTRKTLAAVMSAHRGYNEETADIYARHSIQILKHCGVIDIDGDEISMKLA